jgi:hypothetical protein
MAVLTANESLWLLIVSRSTEFDVEHTTGEGLHSLASSTSFD